MSEADSHTSECAAEGPIERGDIAHRHLLGEIARGRTSVVYLAASRRPHGYRVFALKDLPGHLRGDEAAVSAFVEAARVARRLDHPNLVRAFDVGADGDPCLLAMEFVDGPSYERVVRRARKLGPVVPLRMHLGVLLRVLSALEHVHALPGAPGTPGLVHRRVSPQSVFVTYDGRVKLRGPGPKRSSTREGQAGVSRGSSYLAPECLYGTTVDARADVFAVGVMLYEAILWSQPAATEPGGIGERLVWAEGAGPDADPALLGIARCAMDGDPGARYPSARTMREAIEQYAAEARLLLPDARDFSASVSSLFAQERQKQQAVIKARLGALDVGEPDTPDLPPRILLTPSMPPVSVRPSAPPPARPSAAPPAAPPVTQLPVVTHSVPPPASRAPAPGSMLGYAIAASVAAIVAAGAVTRIMASASRRVPPAQVASASLGAATTEAAQAPPAPVAVPAPPRADLAPTAREAPAIAAAPAPPPLAVAPLVRPPPAAYVPHAPTPPRKPAPTPASAPASAPTPTPTPPPPPDSPLATPPPKPNRAIHTDNPYLQ